MTPRPDEESLNTDISGYFRDAYEDVMYSGSVGVYSRLVHKWMERPYRRSRTSTILEVGAGHGQHAPYVTSDYDTYLETDIDSEMLERRHEGADDPRLRRTPANAEDLRNFENDSVDRVIATCLLAHLTRPEEALLEWRRVVRPAGLVTIYVPTEPGMLLRLLRTVAMVPKSRKFGQDHLAIIYRDHRNHYPSMRILIDSAFAQDKIRRKRYPIPFLGWNFALFEVFHITVSEPK